jgi:VanZ family protein
VADQIHEVSWIQVPDSELENHYLPGDGFLFYSWPMNSGKIPLSKNPVLRFLPAFLTMLAIFLFSAGSAFHTQELLLQTVINKGGHMIGYGLLALAFWRIFEFEEKRFWLVWLLAVLYALTDEYHQSFVAGRHPSLFDALVYDALGALIALWLASRFLKSRRPDPMDPVAKNEISS